MLYLLVGPWHPGCTRDQIQATLKAKHKETMRFTATTVRDIFQLELKFQFGWRLRTNFTELRFFLKEQMLFSFWSSRDRFSLDKPRYVNSLQYINAQYIYTFLFLKIAYMLNQGNYGYHGKLHFFASMAIYGNCVVSVIISTLTH